MNLFQGTLFEVTVNHGYMLQILLAEALYTLSFQRRSHFAMRAVVGTELYCLLCLVVPNFVARYTAGFFSMIMFVLSVGLCAYLFDVKLETLLFACIGAQLTQNLSYNIENTIYFLFPGTFTSVRWLILSVCVTGVTYAACYFLFARPAGRRKMYAPHRVVYIIAVMSALFVYAVQYMYMVYQIHSIWLARLPLVLCCGLGLFAMFGWLTVLSEKEEKLLLERLIEKEKAHYEASRDNMDALNRKAHDLKHQLLVLEQTGRMDAEELQDMTSTVEQFEQIFHTGNPILDIVLEEKNMICQRNQIQLMVIADGGALSFMKNADVAAFFGNALDNAIECECQVEKTGLRYVSMNIHQENDFVSIMVENYLNEARIQNDEGLFDTTKSNKQYHGFGLRSMKYIARKYGGSVYTETKGSRFILNAILPMH